MKDLVVMTRKERDQIALFEQVKQKKLTQIQACSILKLSYRQIKRKFKRYLREGPDGLIHKGRGRESNRKLDQETIDRILEILKDQMQGFGPTFASEKLWELHGISINHETLRQIMIEYALWEPKRKYVKKHVWRERKHCLGELIQLDGSKHIWFGGVYYTLLLFIDDATGRIMYAEFADEETVIDIGKATQKYIKLHGRPIAIYVDRGKVFKINTGSTDHITQYHRMLTELNIELIFAYSPQAKGRVERSFGTHQDRLVKELQLAGITSIEKANKFLHQIYIPKHNAKFSVAPLSPVNVHRSAAEFNLNSIFCFKINRILKEDNTIVYKNRWFQLDKKQPVILRIKQTIQVAISFDGTIKLMAQNKWLFFKEIPKRLQRAKHEKIYKERKYQKPPPDHPWRQSWSSRVDSDISTLHKRGHF